MHGVHQCEVSAEFGVKGRIASRQLLACIGRNINQIAKVANEGGGWPSSVREKFRAMLRICEALRENTKALLKENLRSWRLSIQKRMRRAMDLRARLRAKA